MDSKDEPRYTVAELQAAAEADRVRQENEAFRIVGYLFPIIEARKENVGPVLKELGAECWLSFVIANQAVEHDPFGGYANEVKSWMRLHALTRGSGPLGDSWDEEVAQLVLRHPLLGLPLWVGAGADLDLARRLHFEWGVPPLR